VAVTYRLSGNRARLHYLHLTLEADPGDAFARFRDLLVRQDLAVIVGEAPHFIYLHADVSVYQDLSSPNRCAESPKAFCVFAGCVEKGRKCVW
jgi:hypothetical protein